MHQTAPLQAFRAIRLAATMLMALAAVYAFSGTASAAVFGADDRTRLDDRDAALQQKIGTLTATDNGSFCTAFCVAADMIATASHCLFGTAATPGPKLRELRFKLGASSVFDRGTAIAGGAIANQNQNIVSGTRRLAVAPPIGAAEDWAVARLERPLCAAGGLTLTKKSRAAIAEAAARGGIYQVAVHSDLSDTRLRRGGPCEVEHDLPKTARSTKSSDFTEPDSILFHTCDTGGGSSGSPLLIDRGDGPEVVALNVGTYVLARSVPTARNSDRGAEHGEPIANTAIVVPGIAAAISELAERDLLTTSTGIRRVQQLLREAGLYHGEISGRASNALITAVKMFEETLGAPIRGSLTRQLIADLERWQKNRTPQMMMIAPVRTLGQER